MADATSETTEPTRKKGKHPEKALSAAFVRTVSDAGKYNDGHGLFLRVDKSGAKRWVQRIVIKGKRTELGLGSLSLVSLAEARETAIENRKVARAGGDPLRAKREAQAVLTFEEAARKVHEIHLPSWRNKKHAAQFVSTLETYAFPRIGQVKVSEVTTADVLAVLQPIWLTKAETARRVRQRIGTVLKWAIAQGWRQDNPAQDIGSALPRQDKTQKHRKSIPYSEVAAFLEAVHGSNALQSTKYALELLVLTATRSGEVRNAWWDEFDLEKAVWTIPAERMKANKEHRVPLAGRAVEMLGSVRSLDDGSGLVFPATRYGKPLSVNTLSELVRKLGYDAHVHGFRTSFKTWTQERTNYPREISEAALAHTIKDKAEAAYARSDLFEKRRQLMERWAAYLSESESSVAKIG